MKRSGFSLVELSIVLVILGLLVGGILAGQSLIRAAELRNVTKEFNAYQTSAHSFRDKYMALPGDMNNAESFWGSMTNCGLASPSGTGTQTCNGDNDGLIEPPTGSGRTGESFAFWKHLANAGLIEGSYTGYSGTGSSNDVTIATNVPASRVSNAGWYLYYAGNVTACGACYFMDYGNTFMFGSKEPNSHVQGKALTPTEAWGIDTKIDDGRPAYGKVIAYYRSNVCSAARDGSHEGNDLDADYNLDESSTQCALYFRNNF